MELLTVEDRTDEHEDGAVKLTYKRVAWDSDVVVWKAKGEQPEGGLDKLTRTRTAG